MSDFPHYYKNRENLVDFVTGLNLFNGKLEDVRYSKKTIWGSYENYDYEGDIVIRTQKNGKLKSLEIDYIWYDKVLNSYPSYEYGTSGPYFEHKWENGGRRSMWRVEWKKIKHKKFFETFDSYSLDADLKMLRKGLSGSSRQLEEAFDELESYPGLGNLKLTQWANENRSVWT